MASDIEKALSLPIVDPRLSARDMLLYNEQNQPNNQHRQQLFAAGLGLGVKPETIINLQRQYQELPPDEKKALQENILLFQPDIKDSNIEKKILLEREQSNVTTRNHMGTTAVSNEFYCIAAAVAIYAAMEEKRSELLNILWDYRDRQDGKSNTTKATNSYSLDRPSLSQAKKEVANQLIQSLDGSNAVEAVLNSLKTLNDEGNSSTLTAKSSSSIRSALKTTGHEIINKIESAVKQLDQYADKYEVNELKGNKDFKKGFSPDSVIEFQTSSTERINSVLETSTRSFPSRSSMDDVESTITNSFYTKPNDDMNTRLPGLTEENETEENEDERQLDQSDTKKPGMR